VLERLPKERFRQIPSMRFNYFSELMKNASAMVGNSSAGVREAPFLGVPSLEVGTRQNRRASGASITACSAMDPEVIDGFLNNIWGTRFQTDTTFGAGQAAAGFVEVLNRPDFWLKPLQKAFAGD